MYPVMNVDVGFLALPYGSPDCTGLQEPDGKCSRGTREVLFEAEGCASYNRQCRASSVPPDERECGATSWQSWAQSEYVYCGSYAGPAECA